MRILIIIGLSVMFGAGCISHHVGGSPIPIGRVSDVRAGHSTKDEVRDMFGAPYRETRVGDLTVWVYRYAPDLQQFALWPWWWSRDNGSSQELIVSFNPDGTVSACSGQ